MKWNFTSESNLVLAVEKYGVDWKKISKLVFHGFPAEKLRNKYYKMRQRGLLENYIGASPPAQQHVYTSTQPEKAPSDGKDELQHLIYAVFDPH